jgi:hypothetical protein
MSDQLRLESSTQHADQGAKATLDTLQEGVAVFGLDGRLKLHNAAFAHLAARARRPRRRAIQTYRGSLCRRFKGDGAWGIDRA